MSLLHLTLVTSFLNVKTVVVKVLGRVAPTKF